MKTTLPRAGGYSLFNAGLSYDYRQFSSRLRLNNLTGKRYDSFAGQSDFVAGNKALYSAPEEQVQLSVGYRF
jgi:iron complex outermembrane receptor protein